MSGRATFTIVASRKIMNRPTLVASSVSIWRFVNLSDATPLETSERRVDGRRGDIGAAD